MQETARLIPIAEGPAERVADILSPAFAGMGYALVNIRLEAMGGRRRTLQVTAETRDGRPVTVKQCEELSRATAALLDVEDVIKESYFLEVSSPGIDRDLVRLKDFNYALGFDIKVRLKAPLEGRLNFRGRLLEVDETRLVMEIDGQKTALPLASIFKAKAVLTDELIEAKKVKQ